MNAVEGLAIGIAVAALIVSWWVGRGQIDLQKRVTTVEETRHERESLSEISAHILVTRWDETFPPSSGDRFPQRTSWIRLQNRGLATAHDVEWTLDDENEDRPRIRTDVPRVIPVLHPEEFVDLYFVTSVGQVIVSNFTVRWRDGREGTQEKTSLINL